MSKYKITVIVDGETGHGRYTVAREIEKLTKNTYSLRFFDINVKTTSSEYLDIPNEKSENNMDNLLMLAREAILYQSDTTNFQVEVVSRINKELGLEEDDYERRNIKL